MLQLFVPDFFYLFQNFQRIAGPEYTEVRFSDGFLPEAITVRNRDDRVNPGLLSYGTKEQLNILVRLTLGQFLAKSEGQRQLVVLDDPLAHTDSERQKRMLELLKETEEQLQLVILTCHPGDYQELAAKSFDLEELKQVYERSRE